MPRTVTHPLCSRAPSKLRPEARNKAKRINSFELRNDSSFLTFTRRTTASNPQSDDDDPAKALAPQKECYKRYIVPVSMGKDIFFPLFSRKQILEILLPSTLAFNYSRPPDSSAEPSSPNSTPSLLPLSSESAVRVESSPKAKTVHPSPDREVSKSTGTDVPLAAAPKSKISFFLLHKRSSLNVLLLSTDNRRQKSGRANDQTPHSTLNSETKSPDSPSSTCQNSSLIPQLVPKVPQKDLSAKRLLRRSGGNQNSDSDGGGVPLVPVERPRKRSRHHGRSRTGKQVKRSSSIEDIEGEKIWICLEVEPDMGCDWCEDEWSSCGEERMDEGGTIDGGEDEASIGEKRVGDGWMGEGREFWG